MNSSKNTSTLQRKFRNAITWSWNNTDINNCDTSFVFQKAKAVIQECTNHACQQLIRKMSDLDMASRRDTRRSDVNVGSELTVDVEILLSISVMPDSHSPSAWIRHIGHKCSKFLREKATTYIRDIVSVEKSGVLKEKSHSLMSIVTAIIGDKLTDEVIALVEFVMGNVMEEFERSLVSQGVPIKKLKHGLREVRETEDKIVARTNELEALAVDNAEQIKFLAHQWQKIKTEKMLLEDERKAKEQNRNLLIKEREETGAAIQELKEELQTINNSNQEQVQHLEHRKGEIELQLQEIIKKMGHLLVHSKRNDDDLEAISGTEIQNLIILHSCYKKFLSGHVEILTTDTRTKEEIAVLEEQLQGLTNAVTTYPEVFAQNRKLYREVQDLKGNIRVYCRIRPFHCDEHEHGKQSTIGQIGKNGELIIINPNKEGKDARRMFHFNKVFGPSASQEEVYLDTQPLIRSVLDGYNVCIFAYGQTGSGKTYTMTGPNSSLEKDRGVNYRALNDLFQISQQRISSFTYQIGIQMIEIYNEQVRDLLGSQKRLGIRCISKANGLAVPDATMRYVKSTENVLRLMKNGEKIRAVGATKLNEHSSRSHSVLTVHVEGTDLSSGAILRGRLHLVDLAGSERVERSKVIGERLREAQKINKSLSSLGNVISALANKSAHIPYRNSKLTQILQDSLGGQAKALVFVQVNPNTDFFWETISTLKFAERASSVEMGTAQRNKESKEIRELKEKLEKLTILAAKRDSGTGSLNRL